MRRFTERLSNQAEMPERGSRAAWLFGRGNVAGDRESYFVWQERTLDVLVSWGIGNMIAGAIVSLARRGIPRAIGVQAIAWGAVDTVIALYAQCVARKHAISARSGLMAARHIQARAEHFEYLIVLNSAADVVYVLLGSIVAVKFQSDWVRGTAIGIVIQGGALLVYDVAMMFRMIRRPETHYSEPVFRWNGADDRLPAATAHS